MKQIAEPSAADVPTSAKAIDRREDKAASRPDRAEASAAELESAGQEPRSVALLILVNLAILFTLYVASDFVIPIVMAIIIYLLLQTPKRLLCNRLRIPAPITSLLLILALFSLVGAVGAAVSVPASGWIAKAPESLPTLQEKLGFLRRPLGYVEQGMQKMQQLLETQGGTAERRPQAEAQTSAAPPSTSAGIGSVGLTVLSGTRAVVGNLFMFVVMLFFLLSSGESLLRRLVEVMPRFRDKRRLVEISEKIEQNISGYLLTITIMNTLVGIAVGLATWACGLPDPLLWGTAAFLLNYIPILGPFCGVVVFFFVGLFTYQTWWNAFIPAGLYLLIHVLEGETITPMLLARRFTLNPVLVILSLFFWDYVWGVIGALLAVPLLTILKIVCDEVPSLQALGHVIGNTPKRDDATGAART
ncbi:MAG: AI-2E family transporter [Acetobacteraceae bacterium]|nr:AI-2E family transporter [Acetobacteraceae bacterium]